MLGGLELGSRLLGLFLGDENASFLTAVTNSAVDMFGLGGDAHDDARAAALSALTDYQDLVAGNVWGGDPYQSYVSILQDIRQSSGQAAEMGLTAEDVYGYMLGEGMLPIWAPDPYAWHDELRDFPAKYEDERYMRLDFFGGDDLAESYFYDRPSTYFGPTGVLNMWEERDLNDSEQWDAWTAGLSPEEGKLAEGSRAFSAVDLALPNIMGGLDESGADLADFIAQLSGLADIMPLTAEAEAALNEQSALMAELWQQGSIQTGELSLGLQGAFAEALAMTAASSEMTSGAMSTLVDMLMDGNLGAAGFWQGLTSLADSMNLPVEASQPLIEATLGLAQQLSAGQITTDIFAASLGQIAAGMGLSSENSAAFVQGVLNLVGPLTSGGAAAGSLGLTVESLAAALGSSAGESSGLAGALSSLEGALAGSSAQAATSGASIVSTLAPALGEAGEQAAAAAAQANDLSGAIGSIPTSWDSSIYITRYYQTVGTPFHEGGLVYHGGGQVLHDGGLAGITRMHHGGWFDDLLKPYEVPAILKRGEYVVKDSSVTGETLPWLAEVNRTGRIPGGAGGDTHLHVNSPLVVVEGGLLGDEETLEDLARLLQGKLAEIGRAHV
jgi:hypothetical protein